MTVRHTLCDHEADTKNNFDSMTQSLKFIEKDYRRQAGCVFSPHFLWLHLSGMAVKPPSGLFFPKMTWNQISLI